MSTRALYLAFVELCEMLIFLSFKKLLMNQEIYRSLSQYAGCANNITMYTNSKTRMSNIE